METIESNARVSGGQWKDIYSLIVSEWPRIDEWLLTTGQKAVTARTRRIVRSLANEIKEAEDGRVVLKFRQVGEALHQLQAKKSAEPRTFEESYLSTCRSRLNSWLFQQVAYAHRPFGNFWPQLIESKPDALYELVWTEFGKPPSPGYYREPDDMMSGKVGPLTIMRVHPQIPESFDPAYAAELLNLLNPYRRIIKRHVNDAAEVHELSGQFIFLFREPGGADRAVRAAVEIIRDLTKEPYVDGVSGGNRIPARIAIHTDNAVFETFRAKDKIGPFTSWSIHVADVLQKDAVPNSIVLSEGTGDVLTSGVPSDPVDVVEIRGHKINRHRIRMPNVSDGELHDVPSHLVGREQEITALRTAWERFVGKAGPPAVQICGPARIGKSRLVHEWLTELGKSSDAVQIVMCECLRFYQRHSLRPVLDSLIRLFGLDELAGAKRDEQLKFILNQLAIFTPHTLAVWKAMLFDEGSPNEEGDEPRHQLVGNLLVQLSRQSPLVLVVDNLHWADSSTLEVIKLLLGRERGSRDRYFIVATYQAQAYSDSLSAFADTPRIELKPLATEASVEMIRELIDPTERRPAEQELRRILDRASGNPAAIKHEVLRFRQLESMEQRGDQHKALVLLQLDNEPDALCVAQFAAVLGFEFSFAWLRDVWLRRSALDQHVTEAALVKKLQEALFRLVSKGVLVFPSKINRVDRRVDYSFRDEFVRDCVRETITPDLEEMIVGHVAEVVGTLFPKTTRVHPDFLLHFAEVLTLAGDKFAENAVKFHGKAIELWHRAGRRSVAFSSNYEALRCFDSADELLNRLPSTAEGVVQRLAIQLDRIKALTIWKGYAHRDVEEAIERALELLEEFGDERGKDADALRFRITRDQWSNCFNRGLLDEAEKLAGDLSEQSRGSLERDIEARHILSLTHQSLGEFGKAVEDQNPILEMFGDKSPPRIRLPEVFSDHDPVVCLFSQAACTNWFLGNLSDAFREMDRALKLAKSQPPTTKVVCLCYAALLHLLHREPEVAESHASKALDLARDNGIGYWGAMANILQAAAVIDQDRRERVDDAIAQIKQGMEKWSQRGQKNLKTLWLSVLSSGYLKIDNMEQGRACIKAAKQIADSTQERFYVPEVYRIAADVCLREKDLHEAEEMLNLAIAAAASQESKVLEVRALIQVASITEKRQSVVGRLALLYAELKVKAEKVQSLDLEEAAELLREEGVVIEDNS